MATKIASGKRRLDTTAQAHSDSHAHEEGQVSFKMYLPAIISFVMLIAGIFCENVFRFSFFNGWVSVVWYLIAYLPVGFPVVRKGVESIARGALFTEFLLMSIATIGAFAIGQYPEAVAVMLFYTIGELFQNAAVTKAKRSIKALLDIRPDKASVIRNNEIVTVAPETVLIGETIQIMAGEKVPLDGVMLSAGSSFNTSALTGESKPDTILTGNTVLAGMVNIDKVIQLRVSSLFEDSALAKILFLVQNAAKRKAKTELFIRRFARIYTPVVVCLAIAITLIPYFFVDNYIFSDWLYRALIFLVISCPCALVISIPLGYFGGIGAASHKGILFKGSNYLDLMAKVNTIVMDKTGTLTKGVFNVQGVESISHDKKEFIDFVAALERHSNHPVAKAIVRYANQNPAILETENVEEISGYGMKGSIAGKVILAGNEKLMRMAGIQIGIDLSSIEETMILVAIDGVFAGYITIDDEIKDDALVAVNTFKELGIKNIIMLSGDKNAVVQKFSRTLGIEAAFGDLLPEQKTEHLERLKKQPDNVIAFVGDGINDAPALALADVGIAMGGLGSDAAIETADVVIQTDHPSKIATAIKIGKSTNRIVWQNISLAFGVKFIVLILGAGGLATMWEAVFADVGVALLSILNAVRLQRMNF